MTFEELRSACLLSDLRLELPNWPRYRGPVSARALVEGVALGDGDKVLAVVFFGSSVRTPPETRHRFLFWAWTEPGRRTAADIDVLFLIEGGSPRRADQEMEWSDSDGYSSCWVRVRALHVAVIPLDTFSRMVEARDETAVAILEEGVLLCGELPGLRSGRSFVRDGGLRIAP